jgi:ABC-2 type transport system permease protein
MKNIAGYPAVSALLRSLGIDPVQYGLLIDLFSKLSDRQEFEAGNARFSIKVTVGLFAFISALVNLIVAFGPKPPVRGFIFGNFVFTTFLLLMILTMEAINTFLNPVEAAVLTHQPIRESSYFAAKLTYLAIVVAYVVFPINAVPALVGLNLDDASWLHPITYLISVYLLGFFIALVACGALGFLFRLIPPARVRNVVLWVQIGFFLALMAGPRILAQIRGIVPNINIAGSAALPLNWFVALAAPGSAAFRALFTTPALLSVAACAVFIGFGIQSLTEGYLTRVHVLLRSGRSRKGMRSGVFGSLVRLITGSPSGRAAHSFIYGMARTDWQFRRTAYPMLIQFALLPLLGLMRGGLEHSPFQPGSPTAAQAVPHVAGVMCLMLCLTLIYSNQHRAAWMFLTIPEDSLRKFARGIFWTLWLPVSVLAILFVPFTAWRWGIADSFLFAAYSIAVGSFYLSIELFLIDGLPFANPPEGMRGSMAAPLVILGIVGALVLVGLQWLFIFQSRFVTAGAVLVFGGAAYLIAQISLRYLQTNILHNLYVIASGRGSTAMFKEVN